MTRLEQLELLTITQLWDSVTDPEHECVWSACDCDGWFSGGHSMTFGSVEIEAHNMCQLLRVHWERTTDGEWAISVFSEEDKENVDPDFQNRLIRNFGRLATLLEGEFIQTVDDARFNVELINVFLGSRTPHVMVWLAARCVIDDDPDFLKGLTAMYAGRHHAYA